MEESDVTQWVEFGWNDDEYLPLYKCICGEKFEPWTFNLSIYKDTPTKCPKCGAKLYFKNFIQVIQIIDD